MYKIIPNHGPVTERFRVALQGARRDRKTHVDFSNILGSPAETFWAELRPAGIKTVTINDGLADLKPALERLLDPKEKRPLHQEIVFTKARPMLADLLDSPPTNTDASSRRPSLTESVESDVASDEGDDQPVTLSVEDIDQAFANLQNGELGVISVIGLNSLSDEVKAALIEKAGVLPFLENPQSFQILVDEFVSDDMRTFLEQHFPDNLDETSGGLSTAHHGGAHPVYGRSGQIWRETTVELSGQGHAIGSDEQFPGYDPSELEAYVNDVLAEGGEVALGVEGDAELPPNVTGRDGRRSNAGSEMPRRS